jgi:hypothetical protein
VAFLVALVPAACSSSATAPVSSGSPIGSLPTSARSADITRALESTAAWPFLLLSAEEAGSAGRVTTTTAIDRMKRAAKTSEARTLADGKRRLITEKILVESRAFLRNSLSNDEPGLLANISVTPDEFASMLSRLATLSGRSYASLEVIADLVANITYSATSLRDTTIGAERCQGTLLEFRPADVKNRLATRWNVEDHSRVLAESTPATRFEVWTNKAGEARRIVETGTHFEDGEVIEDVRAQLTFTHLTTAPTITAPDAPRV